MNEIILKGQREDLILRQGYDLPPITVEDLVDEAGNAIASISDAWFTVREGTLVSPGAVVDAIDLTPTISPASPNGTSASFQITEEHVAALTPGNSYCFEIGVVYGGGTECPLVEGMMPVFGRLRASS